MLEDYLKVQKIPERTMRYLKGDQSGMAKMKLIIDREASSQWSVRDKMTSVREVSQEITDGNDDPYMIRERLKDVND
jgi:hypothetical protein